MKKICAILKVVLPAILIALFLQTCIASYKDLKEEILTPQERQWLSEHKGKISLGIQPDYPPLSFVDKEGNYIGATADYLKIIEKKLDFRFEQIKFQNWNELLESAEKGQIDVITAIQNTPDRRKYLNFTSSYITIPNAIIARQNSKAQLSLQKMEGMKVAIVKGYASFDWTKTNYPQIVLEPVENTIQGLQMVSFGRADAMITDLAVATYYIEKLGISNLNVAGITEYDWNLCWGVNKNLPQLQGILQKALDDIPQQKRNQILQRWVRVKYPSIWAKIKYYVLIAAVIVISIIAAIMIWNISLKSQVRQKIRAISESEERFRLFYQKSPLGYQSLDETGCIIEVNPAWLELLGYSYNEVKGKWIGDFLTPSSREVLQKRFPNFKKTGKTRGAKFEFIKKDNSRITVEINGNADYSDSGRFRCTHCVLYDITQQELAQKELLNRQKQLKSLASELALAEEKERRRIAVGMHDDIGSKLALAKIEIQSLQKSTPDKNTRKRLKKQQDNIDQIINEVRSMTFELSNPVLYEIGLEAALKSWLKNNLESKNNIDYNFYANLNDVHLDEKIKIILFKSIREVLTNTIKHANADKIDIRIEKADHAITARIRDNGTGFDTSRLIAPDPASGGFGLFNMKERLEYISGSLEIESILGKGTTVTINVPLESVPTG